MPNIKSAKKRVSVIARRKEENRFVKSTMTTMIKNFRKVVAVDCAKAEALLSDIVSYINSAKSKGVIHSNNASRKVARLNLLLNKEKAKKAEPVAEIKAVAKEVAPKEEPAKKPAVKKSATKKPATKTAEKPAVKKATKVASEK